MAVVCWGFGFYGHGFYLAELKRLHGWPTSLIASASTAYYLFSALLVVFVNDLIRGLGVRACVITGVFSFAVSVAGLPFATEPWHLFAAYALMAVGWTTMSLGAITNILGLWFESRRGLAISLALNGASFGGVIVVPALVFLATAAGFGVAMLTSAALILVVMLPIAVSIFRAPAPRATAGRDSNSASHPATAQPMLWTRRVALASPAFWSVSAPFALALLSQVGFLVHQIAFLEPIIGRHQAGIAVAITTAMAIVGRFALGPFAHVLNQRIASALSLATQAAALGVMTQATDAATLYSACAVYGFSVGNIITFPALIIQREFEAAAFGMLMGLSTGLAQFTYAFGPGLVGFVRDATGTYAAGLAVCMTLNVIAAAVVSRRRAPKPARS
jgi:MFS family permease